MPRTSSKSKRSTDFTKLSSKVIGSDVVGRDIDIDPDDPIEGIYETNGFYFQQRRGRLDLRSLAQLDLEKIVRDVDIDTLQMSLENICFCNLREEDLRYITDQHVVKIFRAAQLVIEYLLYAQEQLAANCSMLSNKYMAKKRSVMKKRKELLELQEDSKALRAQLRSKKKGIKTLESLLKEASRNKKHSQEEVVKPAPEPVPEPRRPSILRFFVSNSNGLCVEFNLKPNTFIYELLKEVRQAFVSRRDRSKSTYKNDEEIQLLYKGKVLLEGHTLQEAGINEDDTIIAVIPSLKEEKEDDEKDKVPKAEIEDNKNSEYERQKEMMAFFAKQQEMMRENWEILMRTMSEKLSNTPHVAPEKTDNRLEIEAKLAHLESMIQNQMRSEFEQMRESLGAYSKKSHFIVGELEDDDDESQRELERKIKESTKKLREMESKLHESELTVEELRKLQRAQTAEMEELRRLIKGLNQEKPQAPAVVEKVASPPSKRKVDTGERKEPNHSKGKWNQFALAGAGKQQSEAPVHREAPKVVEEVVSPKKKPPRVVQKSPPAVQLERSPPPSIQPPKMVDILFSKENMKHLSNVSGIWGDGMEVSVPENITADDLIFEIRRIVAEKAEVPLARACLRVKGRDVLLGVDLPADLSFTATAASSLAAGGDLVVDIRNTVTDAQLDVLASQVESDSDYLSPDGRQRDFSKSLDMRMSLRRSAASNSGSDTEKVYSDTIQSYKKSYELPKRREYDDASDGSDDDAEDDYIDQYRHALSSTLTQLDEVDGLTDEELQKKMSSLKSSMDGLPPRLSRSLSGYRGAVPGQVSAGIESGSEDLSASDNDGPSASISRSASLRREKSLRLTGEGSVGRSISYSRTSGGALEGISLNRGRDRPLVSGEMFSSSLKLSKSATGRRYRDYDSHDDDEYPPAATSALPRRDSPQSNRYSSVTDDDDDDEDDDDQLAREYLKQYEQSEVLNRSNASSHTAEEKREYLSSRNDRKSAKGGDEDEDMGFEDTSSTGSGMMKRLHASGADKKPLSDSRLSSTGSNYDSSVMSSLDDRLHTTVDTDISMPMTQTQAFDFEDSVNKRADQYESDIHREDKSASKPPIDSNNSNNNGSSVFQTPKSGGTKDHQVTPKYSNDTSSPFDHLSSNFDDDNDVEMLEGSLDLSQSNDTFGVGNNLDMSSFSKTH